MSDPVPVAVARRALTVGLGLWVCTAPVAAHDLVIETAVEDDAVVASVTYDDGSRPSEATVVFSRADDGVMARSALDDRGEASIDLTLARDGLVIEAFDDEGHSTYRIVTPGDLDLEKAMP